MYDTKAFWWEHELQEDLKDSKVHETLFDHVRSVEERQHAIHRLNLFTGKLYTNRTLSCLTWGDHSEQEGSYGPKSLRYENIIANGVDTAVSMIGRQRPKATLIPKDADFSVERQCRKLDDWLYTEFKCQKVYKLMQQAFNDCCWAQIGCLFIGHDGEDIYTERVMPDEIVVDQRECQGDQEPLQIHRRRLVSKVVLKDKFPEFEEEIEAAGQEGYTSYRTPGLEMCVVIESWKLALDNEAHGRYSMVIQGATLADEPYKRDKFPFVFLRWTTLPTGFYGRSLVEEGAPFQLRHNELERVIRLSQDLMCVPRIAVDGSSKIIKTQLDNEIARILHYRGNPPIPLQWNAVSSEIYDERRNNIDAFFNFIGLSRMSAQNKLPDGVRLDSSKAIREANYKENERFQRQSAMLEDGYMQVAEHYMELGIELYSGRKAPKKFIDRTILDEIDWKAIGKPGVKYVMQLEASSVANMTPAAREDILNTWANNGIITPDEYKGLSGNPDLEEQESIFTASVDDIKATVEDLDAEKEVEFDPLQNLEFGIPYIHKYYLKRKRMLNVPESVLDGYREWLAAAKAYIDEQARKEQEKQAEQAAQMGMGPEAQMDPNMPLSPEMAAENLSAPVGPDGTPLPAVATTTQGTPVDSLV